jgi:quercetin dioxygenase-like cupin family protein
MIVKTMKHLAAPLLAAVAVFAQDPRVPIENDKVKVVKVTQDPHKKTSLHKHDMNRVMIYLQPGKQTFDYQGEKPKTVTWKAGQALWSPAAGMHIAEIVSDGRVTILELELKNKGSKEKVKGTASDPLKVAPKQYKVEFENDQVRVVRSKVAPKDSVPMHEHSLDRVVVYLTDQDFKITSADGKETAGKHKAGDVSFGTPAKHKEENLSDQPFEIIIVELKG